MRGPFSHSWQRHASTFLLLTCAFVRTTSCCRRYCSLSVIIFCFKLDFIQSMFPGEKERNVRLIAVARISQTKQTNGFQGIFWRGRDVGEMDRLFHFAET
uniref:Putative secreted peptide n=1 Tax=Anopheles braziliensis TaxID=58242 RepID=A0A2M3ZNH0_9DIPT